MSTDKALTSAINLLIIGSRRNGKDWATLFGIPTLEIEQWQNGEAYPNDRQMTTILYFLEDSVGCRNSATVPEFLDHFWTVVEKYEQDPSTFRELDREVGEPVWQRLTRFTNAGWDKSTSRDMQRVVPRLRRKFIDAPLKLV